MEQPRPPLDRIKYLAFEGGGGKGMAYLGAIQALEELIPAPSPEPPQVDEGQFIPSLKPAPVEA